MTEPYSALDDAMLDHQAGLWDEREDRAATVVVATFAGAQHLARARAAFFGDRQQVRQVRRYRLAGLTLATAWSVSPA